MKMIFIVLMMLATAAYSATINSLEGDLYQGQEFVNDRPTGQACYLYIDQIEVNSIGKHCYNLVTRPVFTADLDQQPKDPIKVMGHITNFHRAEYSRIKTCAQSLDGKTSGDDIYSDNENGLFNKLFSWSGKYQGKQFDFFITFSAATKLPTQTRMHKLGFYSETNYDCVKLQKL